MIKPLVLSTLGFFLFFSPGALGGELNGIIKNNEGVSRYEKGRPMDAYGFFTDALGELPFAPEIQYNIGNSFLQMKDVDKAISQYKLALKLAPGESKREKEVRFRALFNTGAILASQNKTEEALESYQKALALAPDSLETKTNMELLTQSGGSGGKGDKDSKEKKENGDGGGDDQKEKQVTNKPRENQPQPYKGKDLSRQDVDRILDELKQQEEAIRAKDQHEGGKDAPPDKDW